MPQIIPHRLSFLNSYKCKRGKRATTYCLQGIEHPCFGFLLEGRCTLKSGKIFSEAKTGELIHIPKRCRYISEWYGDPEIIFLGIAYDFEEASPDFPPSVLGRVDGIDSEKARLLMQRMYDAENDIDGILLLESLFFEFMREVRPMMPVAASSESRGDVCEKGRKYIREHFTESFQIADAASECALSESRFYRVFKSSYGMTPIEYRTMLRIRYAARLLEEGKLSVEEVAGAVGFSSCSHFRENFKAYTGMAPKDYATGKSIM